ncbi:hypothetical protein [Deinococcus soli (ex Cha et al. 2016)]|uniref:Uncharacterized protein n=2 Tax=Deinococcus soli (ex Cha et al. 2016) TaxID=1309411 RepID=A0AAE3XDD7_9DEIO|nr:hypothetical protein [Deinococcus soli (ex Cha et al. 2016)]MDR6218828.1 hypothetical protein [Deinococcus soli (ex Cha et al. 2016)]MDR6328625.1 hypothetical protein [Deinococcus soli (ex Cha et al. 2016)]MDR6751888.1 hypothetical protein [Deinococcus soli (ex Cha et al. 2016)]
MGGNHFKFGRLPRESYLRLETQVRSVLDTLIPGRWRIPRYHHDKADFGDLDVLVDSAVFADPAFLPAFHAALNVQHYTRLGNAHAHGVPFKGGHFQVDLFGTPAGELDVREAFMAWGDLGNILGRLLRPRGLVWGENGLSYIYRRRGDPHYKAEHRFSTDPHDAFRAAGLDYARVQRGFASQAEMFLWVTTSSRFNTGPFLAPQGDFARRVKERPGMQRFAQFLIDQGYPVPLQAHRRSEEERETQRREQESATTAMFPQLKEILAWEREQETYWAVVNAKFNGERIRTLRPELSGLRMDHFRRSLRNEPDFFDWVHRSSQEDVDARVRAWPAPATTDEEVFQAAERRRVRDEKKLAAKARRAAESDRRDQPDAGPSGP